MMEPGEIIAKPKKFRLTISLKIISSTTLLIVFVISFLSYYYYQKSYRDLEEKFGSVLQHIVQTASIKISGDQHNKIRKLSHQKKKPFKKISAHLRKVMKANSLTHETIYTFRITKDKKLAWAVMLHKKPFIGEIYEPSHININLIARTMMGHAQRSKIYKDKYGQWISAYAPIRNSERDIVGILEADYKVEKFIKEINESFLGVISIALIIFLIGIIIIIIIAKKISNPIRLLIEAVKKIQTGEYNLKLKVNTKDEIGDLEKSFNEMANSLGERFYMLKYISEHTKEMIQKVVKNEVSDKGEFKNVVILFSDIRGFTEFSNRKKPVEVVEMLNKVLSIQTEIISEYDGRIDKFVGDEVVAIFEGDFSVMRVVQAASKIHRTVEKMVLENKADIILRVGVGISMGEVIFGNIGSEKRKDFTIVGSEVNLASRLCSQAEPSQTLVSKKVFTVLKDFPESRDYDLSYMGDVTLKGFSQKVAIYSVSDKVKPKEYPNIKEVNKLEETI